MGFSAPLWLLLGLIACAAILAMHSRSWRTVEVGTLQLWNRIISAGGQSRRLHRPAPSLPLFLQLGIAAAIAIALADPFVGAGSVPDHRIFVVDASGAIVPAADDPTITASAAALAAELRANPPTAASRVSVVRAGARGTVIAAGQERIADAAGLARTIAADDGGADWAGAAALAGRLVQDGDVTDITLITNAGNAAATAALPDAALIAVAPDPLPGNLALSAELVPLDDTGRQWQLAGMVIGTPADGGGPVAVVVSFRPDGMATSLVLHSGEVAIGEAFAIAVGVPGPGDLVARIDDGALPFDNQRAFTVAPPEAPLVLAVGDVPPAILRAIEASSLATIETAAALPVDAARFDLVIVATSALAELPSTNVLIVAPAGANPGAVRNVASTWTPEHPLSHAQDWAAVEIPAGAGTPLLAGATALLGAGEIALVQARTTANGREVVIGFDVGASNWPSLASFPIFFSNLLGWITAEPNSCTVGTACTLDPRALRAALFDPDGTPIPLAAAALAAANGGVLPAGEVLAFTPGRAGIYRLVWPDGWMSFAVGPDTAAAALTGEPASAITAPADHPSRLWVVAVAIAAILLVAELIVVLLRAEHRGIGGRSRAVTWTLRVASLVVLVAAFAQLATPSLRPAVNRVVVIPEAGLAGGPDAAAILAVSETIRGVVAVVGTDPVPGSGDRPFAIGDRNATPAERLALAAAALPGESGGRIVMRADFGGADGALDGIAGEILSWGITVDLIVAAPPAFDVALDAVEAPPRVFGGDNIDLVATARASTATEATLTISRGGAVLSQQVITLAAGANRIDLNVGTVEPGEHLFEIGIAAPGDTVPANDHNGVMVAAAQPPRLAILTEDPAAGDAFAAMLSRYGIEAVRMAPGSAPYFADRWRDYEVIALLNLPAVALATGQQEALREAVEIHGRGLLMLGGENTFGPGGYYQTPLEALSPLSSRVPRDAPRTAMVFVIDRSGSMQQLVGGATRLAIAREATLNAMALLHPEGEIAVIAFDSEAQTVIPLRPVGDMAGIEERLTTIVPAGGTSMYPGLVLALEQLGNAESTLRHVIVMTDGLSQPGDFPAVVAELRAAGATVSTVAIGAGLDTNLLETVARLGGGAFHEAVDAAALPSILSQEAMLLSGSPLELGRTIPYWTGARSGPFAGLPETLPPIDGFVLTTAKPTAEIVLSVPDTEGVEMPLLATWRAGNGFVLALATQAVGPWTSAWNGLPEYARLWAETVRGALPETIEAGIGISRSGDVLTVAADAGPGAIVTDLRAIEAPGAPAGPADGAMTILADQPGLYRFAATVDGEPVERAMFVGYPARYRSNALAAGSIEALRRASGGSAFPDAEAAFADNGVAIAWQPDWRPWAVLAILLFMIELAIRYLARQSTRPARGRAAVRVPGRDAGQQHFSGRGASA